MIFIFISYKHEEKNIRQKAKKWIEYDSKDSIPKQFFQVLKVLNDDEKIADKNEDYETTDNISDTK